MSRGEGRKICGRKRKDKCFESGFDGLVTPLRVTCWDSFMFVDGTLFSLCVPSGSYDFSYRLL